MMALLTVRKSLWENYWIGKSKQNLFRLNTCILLRWMGNCDDEIHASILFSSNPFSQIGSPTRCHKINERWEYVHAAVALASSVRREAIQVKVFIGAIRVRSNWIKMAAARQLLKHELTRSSCLYRFFFFLYFTIIVCGQNPWMIHKQCNWIVKNKRERRLLVYHLDAISCRPSRYSCFRNF